MKSKASNTNIIHFTYKHLYGLTWQVTSNFYCNCDYYGSWSGGVDYGVHDTCNFPIKQLKYALRANILPNGLPYKSNCYRPFYCPATLTSCDSPFNATGFVSWRHIQYIDTLTLPESCGLWKFTRGAGSSASYRDPLITNIDQNIWTYYGEAVLNADSTKPNSSAVWERPMFMYACENEPTQWHLPLTDPDGDSLVYTLVLSRERDLMYPNPLDTLIKDITYKSPYNLNQPFETNESWRFVPTVPKVQFNAAPNQLALLTFKVEEYRQGVYMGATFRDVLIHIIPCTNAVPQRTIDTMNSQGTVLSVEDTVEVYAGQLFTLCSNYTSSNSMIKHESNIPMLLPQASYTAMYMGGPENLRTCLQWTPTLADTGVYLLVTTVQDTSCAVGSPKIPQDYFHRLIVHGYPQSTSSLHRASDFIVYPNPSKTKFHIQCQEPHAKKEMFDHLGKLLLTTTENEIDVQQMQRGLYFIRCKGGYQKVVVQ